MIILLQKQFSKHGKEFTQSTVNKLSQSFSLNVVSGRSITTKQVISQIQVITKNSMNKHFFLNEN